MKKLNKLKQIRLSMDMSLEDMGDLCGVSSSTIMRVENFEMIPTQTTILLISRGLKMDAWEIFNLDYRTFN